MIDAPTSSPSSAPSLSPTFQPTLLPTVWNSYNLEIKTQLIVQCNTTDTFNQWFIKSRYIAFNQWLTVSFSELATVWLQYYQFYVQIQTMNEQINVTSQLPDYFNGNTSILKEYSQTLVDIYDTQITEFNNNRQNMMGFTLQIKIYAIKTVESVFHQLFQFDLLKTRLEVKMHHNSLFFFVFLRVC